MGCCKIIRPTDKQRVRNLESNSRCIKCSKKAANRHRFETSRESTSGGGIFKCGRRWCVCKALFIFGGYFRQRHASERRSTVVAEYHIIRYSTLRRLCHPNLTQVEPNPTPGTATGQYTLFALCSTITNPATAENPCNVQMHGWATRLLPPQPPLFAMCERISAYRVSAVSRVHSRGRNVTFVRQGYAFPNGTFKKYAAA